MSKRVRQRRRYPIPTTRRIRKWLLLLSFRRMDTPEILGRNSYPWLAHDICEPYLRETGHKIPDQEFVCFNCQLPNQKSTWHYTIVPSLRRVFFTSYEPDEWDLYGAAELTRELQKRFGKPR